jgi:hypothetical protein
VLLDIISKRATVIRDACFANAHICFQPARNGTASGLAGLRGRVGRKVGPAEIKRKRISELKVGFLNLPRLWKFVEGDLGEILT